MTPALKKPGSVLLPIKDRCRNACNKNFVLNKVCGSEHHSGHLPPAVLMARGADTTGDHCL